MQKYAIIYCRVSDKSQLVKGHSLEQQEPMLKEFAKSQGYKVVKVFKDAAKSGTSTHKRDGLMDAMRYIEQENRNKKRPKIHVFIVQDTDRLARQEFDHHHIRQFLRQHKVTLLSKNQPGINETPEGQLLDTIMAGVNAFQSRLTGRKVRDTSSRLAAEGRTTHKAPVGYVNKSKEVEGKVVKYIEPDGCKAHLVKQMFHLYSGGTYSLASLARHMNKAGLRSTMGNEMSASSIAEIFNNRYYLGEVKYNDKTYKGKHKPLITERVFKECQRILEEKRLYASRKRKPFNHKLFFLKDSLKCAVCGYRCTGGGSRGRKKVHNYYYCGRNTSDPKYHSKKGGNCIDLTKLHQEVEAFFGLFELSEDVIDDILEKAKLILDETHGGLDEEKHDLRRTLTKYETIRQNLEQRWLAGDVDEAFYERNHEAVESEITTLEERTQELSNARDDRTEMFEGLVKLAKDVPNAYMRANPNVKKMYLKIFWNHFEIQKGGISKAVPSKALATLLNENLIKLKGNSPKRRVLIAKVWLPSSNGIITLLADADYWRGVAMKLKLIDAFLNGKTMTNTLR